MAWNVDKFTELGNLLAELQDQDGPIDKESQKYKRVEQLLKQLYQAFTRSGVATVSTEAVLEDLEKRRELAKKRGETYLSANESRQQLLAYGRRAERVIREKIKVLYTSGEYTQEEIDNLKEELKVLHKSNKEMMIANEAEAKGAKIAEDILQMTLGISKNSTDIVGAVKGFGKGLKKSLTAANLFATAISKMFDAYGSVDQARADLFRRTGMKGYQDRIIEVGNKLSLTYKVTYSGVAAEMFGEVNEARRSFALYSEKDMNRIAFTAGQLRALGISVSAYSDIGNFLSLNLKQNLDEQEDTLGMLYNLGKKTETSPEKMFREVATSLPVYSRYTKGFATVFAGIHLAAQRTNVDVNDLMTLTESLDTKDEALKQAQKFNALLGGQYLNPVELLAADPGEKVKLIAEAYQQANRSLGDIHPRIVRSLYKNFGLDAQQFKNVVNASFETYAAELSGVQAGVPDLMKQAAKDIEDTKNARDTMDAALGAILSSLLVKILPGIVRIADMALNVATSLSKTFDFMKRMLGMDDNTIAAREAAAASAKMFTGPEALTYENYRRQNVDAPSATLMGGMTAAPPSAISHPVINDAIAAGSGLSVMGDKEQAARILASDQKDKARGIDDVFDFDDTPQVMNMSSLARPTSTRSSVTATSPVPTVEGKFETSMQDDVLLSRLAKLRDKIHEYRSKSTKISLNVGMNNIAEAIV